MQIVTGYKGQAHITANDDQGRNQGTFGEDSYVLSVGSKFAPTLLSANSLKIADGEGVHQGVHFRVDPGTYDTVTIDNGEQGKNRKDLVVCRYTKDGGTGVESCEWVVVKGTAVSGTATRPSHTTGDILGGSLTVDMPFFEVALSGINVSAVTSLFTTVKDMASMQTDINELNSKIQFIRADITASGDVSSLITTVIQRMTNEGEYYFHGTWTTHSYGYSAHCWRRPYSDSVNRYCGIIIAHDGNTWTFSANSTSDVTINLSKAISYVDVSGTTGTSLYGSYYYANIAIPVAARDKFISATILSVTDNRYATVQLNSSSQLRVFCDQSGKTVSVRIAYQ